MHEHLTKDFFWMSRTVLALSPEVAPGRHSPQAAFAEKIVALAAKMAARLINNRVTVCTLDLLPLCLNADFASNCVLISQPEGSMDCSQIYRNA